MKSTTILLSLDEYDCVPKFHEIANNNLKKLVDMVLGLDIYFEIFLMDLNVNEKNDHKKCTMLNKCKYEQ
jgi:hypothetical protein